VRLFECLDGAMINPLLASICRAVEIENKYYVQFTMAGSAVYEYPVNSEEDAKKEMERFKKHFESIE